MTAIERVLKKDSPMVSSSSLFKTLILLKLLQIGKLRTILSFSPEATQLLKRYI